MHDLFFFFNFLIFYSAGFASRFYQNICCGKILLLSADHQAGWPLCKLWEHRFSVQTQSLLPSPVFYILLFFKQLFPYRIAKRNKKIELKNRISVLSKIPFAKWNVQNVKNVKWNEMKCWNIIFSTKSYYNTYFYPDLKKVFSAYKTVQSTRQLVNLSYQRLTGSQSRWDGKRIWTLRSRKGVDFINLPVSCGLGSTTSFFITRLI